MKKETDKLVSIAVLKARDGMGERLRDALLTLIGPLAKSQATSITCCSS